MKKKLFAILLVVLLCAMPAVNAVAAQYGFELQMKADSTNYNPGDSFWVTIYVNKISDPLGLIGLDLLTKYDSKMLTATEKTPIYPSSWEGDGDDFSPAKPSVDTEKSIGSWNTVLVYEGNKISGTGVKTDNSMGIKIKFTVNSGAKGTAKVWVDTDGFLGGTTDFDSSTGKGLQSVQGKGASLTFNIGVQETPSQEPQSQAPSASEAPSEEPSETPTEAPSETPTEEPVSQEQSAIDGSEDASEAESEVSEEQSAVTPDASTDDSIASEEIDDDSSTDNSSKADGDSDRNSVTVIVVIAVVVVAIAAAAIMLAMRKKSAKSE